MAKAATSEGQPLAEVIQLRPPLRKPTCWECVYFRDISDPTGVSSHCSMFDEPIHYEGQAVDCDAYEKNNEEG